MPEDTKPVERELNPDEQRRRDEQWDRQVASLADYNAGWDAALERAAQVGRVAREDVNTSQMEEEWYLAYLRLYIAWVESDAAIRALKGSR